MRSTTPSIVFPFCLGLLAGACSTGEQSPRDQILTDESAREVPVIPDEAPAGQQPTTSSETVGEVQERGLTRVLPGGGSVGVFTAQPLTAVLGEFAIRTTKGYYLTAVNGGGRTADPTIIIRSTDGEHDDQCA